jgi:ubiquinone/menaquinone biosynthesis C-methylase UbiE
MQMKGCLQDPVSAPDYLRLQREAMEASLAAGPRAHTTSKDDLTVYLTRWRLHKALSLLRKVEPLRITDESSILVLCAGEGYEGTVLADLGYRNITVSDLSSKVTKMAVQRDPRLTGIALNAEETRLDANSFDVVVVQDGLHHLQRPTQGFIEMLRITRVAAIFLEPHASLAGGLLGRKWEVHGPAVNYVFRWSGELVEQISSSYLGPDSFKNLSFSFWHHNVVFARLGARMRGGRFALGSIRLLKATLDCLFSSIGNQFCGIVIKGPREHTKGAR